MDFKPEMVQKLAAELLATGLFPSAVSLEKALMDITKTRGGNGVSANHSAGEGSITRIIRGISAMKGSVLNTVSVEEDLNYARKALTTGATPGSYVVPTVQADAIVEILGKGAAVRASGATVWPMQGVQNM